MAYLYTKGGDKGTTGLLGGARISKASLQVDCYGNVDEAGAALGVARTACTHEVVRSAILDIQKRLFLLAAELASDEKGAAQLQGKISEEDVRVLEHLIDSCTAVTGKLHGFVTPGDDPGSAALHFARTVLRRAERMVVLLAEEHPVREELLRYLNRLSDASFALALLEAHLVKQDTLREQVTELVRGQMQAMGVPGTDKCLEDSMRMAKRAEQKSKDIGVPIVFAVVDAGGHLVLLHRMEGALLGSVDIAANKAYTAAAFKMATHELGAASQPGGPLYGIETSNNGRVVLFGGGFPLKEDGKVIGAIGVSGGSVEEDMCIARAAIGE